MECSQSHPNIFGSLPERGRTPETYSKPAFSSTDNFIIIYNIGALKHENCGSEGGYHCRPTQNKASDILI